MNSASSLPKGTMAPFEFFASSVVGCMTVGRQHDACTAVRIRTCGDVM